MKIGSLFSGYGGLDMGVQAAIGGEVAWHVEFDAAPSKILAHHSTVPNLGDITTVDWAAVEPIDVLTGGFPCQDVSHAGKRAGLKPGTRSGLWEHFAYAIHELRPQLVIIENVRGLLSARTAESEEVVRVGPKGGRKVELTRRAMGRVLSDLAELGFDAWWGGVRAADAGAPHGRFRVFIVAQPADADLAGLEGRPAVRRGPGERPAGAGGVGAGPGSVSVGPGGPQPVALGAEVRAEVAGVGVDGGISDLERGEGHAPTMPVLAANLSSPLLPTPKASDGPYGPAIERWAAVLGRPAPSPTEPGRDGRPRLSPAFVEWMMGLPAGHVTDPAIGLTRSQQLKALGNGVVPQQAALALRLLLGLGGTAVPGGDMATLKTPTAQLAVNGGSQHPDKRKAGGHGPALADEVEHLLPNGWEDGWPDSQPWQGERILLPTPSVALAEGGQTSRSGARKGERLLAGIAEDLALLPTPAVNDMGAGKTPQAWDEWTERMKAEHRNGNGHGKSLEIEVLRNVAGQE